jgi:transposase
MDVPSCKGCRERDARIAKLEAEVAELKQQVRELLARLNQDATNSSLPPSANPPHGRKPVQKQKTGRKPGGQPGHEAHLRERLPPERVQQVVPFVPEACHGCGTALSQQAGPNDPEPTWHQYAELRPMAATVTEYQGHARTCAACGEVTRASIPADLRVHTFDPRLTAAMSYLSGCHHLSRRAVEEVVETFFEVPVALGTVSNLEQQMSAALAAPHAEAQEAVQAAAVKHADETGWKQAGQKCWLWVGATDTIACFVISASRGLAGLVALLGERVQGILCSDRWSAYGRWSAAMRQVCWAHLKRDFQKLVDRGGASQQYGTAGLATVQILFHEWHLFLGGGSRGQLQHELEPLREAMHLWLEDGARCVDSKTAKFCRNLLALEPALWTFLSHPGVDPTNNHAERVLRPAVLWRKNAFGSHSEAGCRFVERMQTVVQTLRLRKRSVFAFLTQAITNQRCRLPTPSLLG